LPVSHNFQQFFDIPVIEGSGFEENMLDSKTMIVNKAFVESYGATFSPLIGKKISCFNGEYEIVGVMEDFNFKSLHEPVKPMGIVSGQDLNAYFRTMYIKINGQNTLNTLNYVRDVWKQFSSEPVEINFLDETINHLYKRENNLAKLISTFALITIIVAIMGVYGLILFNVKSKRKTVALHKIHGASVREVILMLNRGFIVQFAVAYIISVPLAYIVVSRWLENFAYKTAIHWWVFVLGGLLVFLITALTVSRQSYRAATENPIEGMKME
jgi:putative ABC transport system permease protein